MLYNLIFWGAPAAALSVYLLLILFFAISKKDRYTAAFQPFLYDMALWTASSLLMKLGIPPGVLFWNRMMMVGICCAPFFFYLFFSIFTGLVRIRRLALWALGTLAAIVFSFMGQVVTSASTVTSWSTWQGKPIAQIHFVYTLGPAAVPTYVLMFLMVFSIILGIRRSVHSHKVSRKMIRPILIGVVLLFCGLLSNLHPALGQYPIDILMCFITGLLFLYAIYRNRMFEMKFMLTRGFVFSCMTAVLLVFYASTVLGLLKFLPISEKTQQLVTVLIAFGVALLAQPLLALAQKLADLICYKSEYNQRNALKNFAINISNNLSLTEISNEFVDAVSQAMNPRHTTLMLLDRESNSYITFQSMQKLNPMKYVLRADNPLVRWLDQQNRCLTREEISSRIEFRAMWDSELSEFNAMNAEVLVPMKCRDSLIGIIMLTARRNEAAYTLDDLELLRFFGASTAVAMSNALLYAKAQKNACTDDMTGIHNRRYFYQYLREQFEVCAQGSRPLSLMILDLDRFKLYNELYGFSEGDRAICKTAELIRRCVDRRGIAARYSGEQFAVVLPGYDTPSALEIAETIRRRIEQEFFNEESATKQFLTISAGLCTYPICAANTDELVQRCNLALSSAKRKGKNVSVAYTTLQQDSPDNPPRYDDDTESLQTTVYALTAAIDAKDHYTFTHSLNVAKYASALAKELGLDAIHQKMVYEAGLLHDVGKIGIPEDILTKTSRLTNEEYSIIKKHVDISINIIKHLPSMTQVIPAIVGHHERWDGRGYPRGIAGERIPIEARCLSIADTFDAITSARPYKRPCDIEFALTELERCAGTQLDPVAAPLFVQMVRKGHLQVTPTLHL